MFKLNKLPKQKQYLFSIAIVIIISSVCFSFSRYVDAEVIAFVLLLTLSVIAMFFDILPVLACSLLSALIWGFFFIPPKFSFAVANVEDIVTLCMYFLISLVSATLTYKIRQMEKIVIEKDKKMQAVKLYNTLLNSLSHEFRTPISAIIAAADNLVNEEEIMHSEAKSTLTSEILTAALRLNTHVENLLNMSRLESGSIAIKKDWCDVKEIIQDTLAHIDEKKNHFIQIDIEDKFPLCKLDFGLMEQVFLNLINNAIQYTAEGSAIIIDAKYEDRFLIVRVKDNGPGFPNEELKKVFDKFYRVNNFSTGGIGLGLSIAKGFVEAHHGKIEVTNRAEGGAEFIIKIPTETINIHQLENEENTYTYN